MKTEVFRILGLCMAFITALPFAIYSQTPANTVDEVFVRIEQQIQRGDANNFAQNFSNHVEITILDKDEIYPKTQAAFVIKEFFMNYPAQSFRILHKGNAGEPTSHYSVGEYVSTRGKFDANIFIRKNGTTYYVERVRFEIAR
jgi:hypothetical protein